jgi:hypothetical protein
MRVSQKSPQARVPASQLDLFAMASRAAEEEIRPDLRTASQTAIEPSRLAPLADRFRPPQRPDRLRAAAVEKQRPDVVTARPRPRDDVRVIGLEDMPSYADLDHEMVQRSMETLPPDMIWFTYSAVQKSFGISRATVARRMKDGLIPGIRFCGANVLEDGSVRRFNRTQLHWLLLAVRTSRLQHAERSISNLRRRAVS